jgi:hypothetical protein
MVSSGLLVVVTLVLLALSGCGSFRVSLVRRSGGSSRSGSSLSQSVSILSPKVTWNGRGVSKHQLWMSRKHMPPSVGNYARKIRRILHSLRVNDTRSIDELYAPRLENYLKYEASDSKYASLMKKINKTASKLRTPLRDGFAYRPPIVLPTIFDHIAANPETKVGMAAHSAFLIVIMMFTPDLRELPQERQFSRASKWTKYDDAGSDRCSHSGLRREDR